MVSSKYGSAWGDLCGERRTTRKKGAKRRTHSSPVVGVESDLDRRKLGSIHCRATSPSSAFQGNVDPSTLPNKPHGNHATILAVQGYGHEGPKLLTYYIVARQLPWAVCAIAGTLCFQPVGPCWPATLSCKIACMLVAPRKRPTSNSFRPCKASPSVGTLNVLFGTHSGTVLKWDSANLPNVSQLS